MGFLWIGHAPPCYAIAMFGTVLLVEDENQVMRLMAKVLEMGGYSVLTAESGDKRRLSCL